MRVTNTDNIADFLHFVATKKNEVKNWQYLHVVIQDPAAKITIDEVQQFLEFHVQSSEACLLRIPKTHELVLCAHKDDSLALGKFEAAVYQNFSGQALATVRSLERHGLEQFSKILNPHINANDTIANVVFKRMSRPSNNILILDDEIMVLKEMEKILSGLGHVVTLENAGTFYETYQNHAPDILFLDIHLGGAKGNKILKDLKKDIDPFAHVIMISSDTKEDVVLDIKEGGAKGFVVKPFNRNILIQHVLKAPTAIVQSWSSRG